MNEHLQRLREQMSVVLFNATFALALSIFQVLPVSVSEGAEARRAGLTQSICPE